MYIIVCTSCTGCNSEAIAVFENEPTEEQIEKVKEAAGDLWCIRSKIYHVTDGEIAKGEIYDYS